MEMLGSYGASQKLPRDERVRFRRTMWPPAAANAPPLERCMRFLPQLADTGGFFIALLRKRAPLPPARRQRRPAALRAALAAARAVSAAENGHALRRIDPEALGCAARFTRSPLSRGGTPLHVPPRVAAQLGLASGGTPRLTVVHAGSPAPPKCPPPPTSPTSPTPPTPNLPYPP